MPDGTPDAILNPNRREEQDRARAHGAARLEALGIRLTGTESVEDIGTIVDAVEEFEEAVESRGGDLMVDEGPHGRTREPDNPDFVLPRRDTGEPAEAFAKRVRTAASDVRRRHRGA